MGVEGAGGPTCASVYASVNARTISSRSHVSPTSSPATSCTTVSPVAGSGTARAVLRVKARSTRSNGNFLMRYE